MQKNTPKLRLNKFTITVWKNFLRISQCYYDKMLFHWRRDPLSSSEENLKADNIIYIILIFHFCSEFTSRDSFLFRIRKILMGVFKYQEKTWFYNSLLFYHNAIYVNYYRKHELKLFIVFIIKISRTYQQMNHKNTQWLSHLLNYYLDR